MTKNEPKYKIDFNNSKDSLIIEVLKKITLRIPNGIAWKGGDSPLVEGLVNLIIGNEIELVNEFAKFRYSSNYLRGAYFRALSILKEDPNPSYEKLKSMLKKAKKKTRLKTFKYLFPISLEFRLNARKQYRINRAKLKFLTLEQLRKTSFYTKTLDEHLNEHYSIKSITKQVPSFILITARSRDAMFGAEESNDQVSLFLALFNLGIHLFRGVRHYPDVTSPTSGILVPKWFYCLDNRLHITPFVSEGPPFDKAIVLREDQYRNFLNIYNRFSKLNQNQPLYPRLVKALLQYQKAITAPLSESFLAYWTCLEILYLKDKNTSHEQLISRILTFFPYVSKTNKLFEIHLRHIKHKRNQYIHEAKGAFTHEDIDLLKEIVERTIVFYMEPQEIRTETELFYLLEGGREDHEIKSKIRVLSYLLKERKKIKRRIKERSRRP